MCGRCGEKKLRCAYEDEKTEPAWKQRVVRKKLDEDGESIFTPTSTTNPSRRASSPSTSASHHDDLAWLVIPALPEHARMRILAERYFVNVHHLRCFAFLHKPSFLQRLDSDAAKNQDSNPLLHIVCALGALFFAVETEMSRNAPLPINPLDAGKCWAERAQKLILARLDRISVENLMAAVLLHDYEIRMGNYSNAFMLSSITARMAQALQINLEHSTDVLCRDTGHTGPSASVKESRRRLMWCCYITDSLVGSGIDQLTLIETSEIKIQLPCNERNFVLEEPCITETLEPGQMLGFLPRELLPKFPLDCMGMTAFYIRHIATRRKVLRYIKHLDTASPPWHPSSEFAQLDSELRSWYNNLPANLQFTPTTLYIRAETSQVGALCALHYAYHQTMCDLYRVGTPSLYRLRSAFEFPPERQSFLAHVRYTLFGHARSLATIMAEALRHGPHAIADSWLPTVLYDSCKIMLFYLTQLIDTTLETSKQLLADTIPLVQKNVEALKIMRSMYASASPLSKAAEAMLQKVLEGSANSGHSFLTEDPYAEEGEAVSVNEEELPAQSAPDDVLNPLSIYRLTRKSIPEKHAPERQPPVGSSSRRGTMTNTPVIERKSLGVNGEDERFLAPELRGGTGADEQMDFASLESLFSSDPTGWTWQPAETAVGSRIESGGLPPWESTMLDGQLDAWLPAFALDP